MVIHKSAVIECGRAVSQCVGVLAGIIISSGQTINNDSNREIHTNQAQRKLRQLKFF